MRKRVLVVAVFVLLASLQTLGQEALRTVPASGARPDYLIRVERRSDVDRLVLLEKHIPLVMETGASLLVMGGKRDLSWLSHHGYPADIIDTSPWQWDYYHVGLRADSDLKALADLGTVLYTEENWVLLRVVPGTDLAGLYGARVFAARVSQEPMKKPLYAEPRLPDREATLAALPLVQQMVSSVADADIMGYWTSIVPASPGSRNSTATGCTDATNYVYNTFTGLGLAAQKHSYRTGYAPNVVGEIAGAVNPSVIYLVEGHVDDMPSTGFAPGADDNGSGTVTVLETAKALSCYAFKNTVRFLTTTGEEQGLYGSTDYAGDSYTAGENIQGVLNMDMPGWEGDNSPAGEDLDLNYDSNSQALGTFYKQCATDYGTGLAVNAFLCPSLDASDHYPFWQKGYKAVCGITDNEGYCSHNGTYPYYHTVNDTILNSGNGTTSHAFFYKVVRTTVAALAALGEPFKVTTDKTTYGTGDTLTLIVGDRDLNTSTTTAQTVTVQVWSTTESTPENVVLTEQGVNSMIFKGTIALTTGAAANGDGKLSVAAGNTITAKYVDAVDCNGATNVTYTSTATVTGTATYSISGTVSGATASGVTMTLSGAASATATTATDGTYTFSGLANGTYTVTPSKTGYTFSPTSTSVTISGASQTGKNFTSTATGGGDTVLTSGVGVSTGAIAASAWKYYTIAVPSGATALSITLTGLTADMDLYVNNSATHPTTSAYYGRSWNSGTTSESLSYTTPTVATWSIGVYGYAAGSGTITATVTTGTATYSISGTVSGAATSGVTMTLSGAASKTTTTATGGTYSFSGLANGTYTVTPSLNGYTFSPASTAVTLSGANQTGKNFTATAVTTTYTISGTVSLNTGGGLSGVTITAGTASVSTDTSGNYVLTNMAPGTYIVTPAKAGYTFSPASTSVTISTGNQTGKNFTATASGGQVTLFSYGFESTTGWTQVDTSGTSGTWSTVTSGTYPTCSVHGGSYMGKFNSYNATSGNATRWHQTSGTAVSSTYTTVTWTFWMYHDTGYSTSADKIQPQVSTNGSTWTSVGTAINRYDGSTGWKQHTVSIATYKGSTVYLGFLATSAYGNNIYLDDVTVTAQ
jgi:hypothetical protein